MVCRRGQAVPQSHETPREPTHTCSCWSLASDRLGHKSPLSSSLGYRESNVRTDTRPPPPALALKPRAFLSPGCPSSIWSACFLLGSKGRRLWPGPPGRQPSFPPWEAAPPHPHSVALETPAQGSISPFPCKPGVSPSSGPQHLAPAWLQGQFISSRLVTSLFALIVNSP